MSTACRSRDEALALFASNKGLAYAALRELRRYAAVRRLGEDGEQLALLALWRCCQTYDPARAGLGSYVFGAVRNALLRAAFGGKPVPCTFTDISTDVENPPNPAAPEEPDPLLGRDLRDQVEVLIGVLPRRWGLVVALRYGLRGHRPHGLREIGDRLDISPERVRQIEARSLKRLRARVFGGRHRRPLLVS